MSEPGPQPVVEPVVGPVADSEIGMCREVASLPDGRRITFYSCPDPVDE